MKDALGRGQSVHAGHLYVDEQHVGNVLVIFRHGGFAAVCGPRHLRGTGRRKNRRQRRADDRIIIGDGDFHDEASFDLGIDTNTRHPP